VACPENIQTKPPENWCMYIAKPIVVPKAPIEAINAQGEGSTR